MLFKFDEVVVIIPISKSFKFNEIDNRFISFGTKKISVEKPRKSRRNQGHYTQRLFDNH